MSKTKNQSILTLYVYYKSIEKKVHHNITSYTPYIVYSKCFGSITYGQE